MKSQAASLAAALVAALASPLVHADDRGDLVTIAAASVVPRTIVSTTIYECTSRYPDLDNLALDAMMEWEGRNGPYETRAKTMIGTYSAKLAPTMGKEAVDKLVADTIAQKRDQATNETKSAFSRTFQRQAFGRHKESCINFVMSLNNGKMDFRAIDKGAFELLESGKK